MLKKLKELLNDSKSGMSLANKFDPQEIDLFDANYMVLFDIRDKEYIHSNYVRKTQAYTHTINSLNQARAKLRNSLRALHGIYNKGNLAQSIEVGIRLSIYADELNKLDKQLYNLRTEQMRILKNFYDLTDKKYNDQTTPDKFDPAEITYKLDVYVSGGIDTIGSQITNNTSVVWEYVEIGKGERPASIGDQELDDPIGRFAIDEGGSFSSIGDQVRLFVVLPDQIEDNDIWEFSVNELPAGGKMLSRSTFKKPIRHKQTKTFPTITNVTYLIPHIEDQ